MHQQYLQIINERIAQQALRVEEAKNQLDNKRHNLAAVLKEKKTLEKLQEIHEAEETRRQLRHESETIDDLVIARYNRREE
jgi:flagellar export protein FliJ